MITDYWHSFLQYINNHFDIFLIILIICGTTFLVSLVLARFRFLVFMGYLPVMVKTFLYRLVVIGQLAMLVGLIGVYWVNYQIAAELIRLPENVLVSTDWVDLQIPIYFIEQNQLHRIHPDGTRHQVVFKAQDPLKEYIFSPDGRYILIISESQLSLYERETQDSWMVDTIGDISGDHNELKGVIRDVQWAKDSLKFFYKINRWSPYASQNNVYVYHVQERSKEPIISPGRQLAELYWNDASDSLYHIYNEALDTSKHGYPFEVRIYRIPLETMKPKRVSTFPYREATVPEDSLALRDIHLYLKGDQYAFGRKPKTNVFESPTGAKVGIDEDDHLYYMRYQWFRKRLFKIEREKVAFIEDEYQKKGGELVLRHISWLPGGQYLIMEHKDIGILIMEPKTKRIGRLYQSQGRAFGWFPT
jgi:hypothetical protein